MEEHHKVWHAQRYYYGSQLTRPLAAVSSSPAVRTSMAPPTEPVTAGCPGMPQDDTRALALQAMVADGPASVVVLHEGDQAPFPLMPGNPTLAADLYQEIWTALTKRYGRAWLDAHQWEWRDGDWLPHYQYWPVSTITELWTEHAKGLGGHLSTQELGKWWGAKWWRNEGSLKTEGGRCSKVIVLIQELTAKPNWNVPQALRFIKEKYKRNPAYLGRVHAFCDYLQKDHGAGYQAILEAACHYP